MKFIMQRNRVVASVLGHAIEFLKGVPTHVPPALYEEVMAAGAVPEDELPVDENKSVELTADERQAKILEAIEKVVLKNDPNEFTAGGFPHNGVLSSMVGFQLRDGERDLAWGAFKAKAAE